MAFKRLSKRQVYPAAKLVSTRIKDHIENGGGLESINQMVDELVDSMRDQFEAASNIDIPDLKH